MLNNDLSGKVASIINDVFNSSDRVNLTFNEFTDPNGKPAKSDPATLNNGVYNETIQLNLSLIKGSSKEFATIIMVHEILHAYMNYNNQFRYLQLQQHQEMAEKYVADMKGFVQQLYPINDPDAYAIILNGLADIFGNNKPAYIDTLKTKYNVDDPLGTYEMERAGLQGTTCK